MSPVALGESLRSNSDSVRDLSMDGREIGLSIYLKTLKEETNASPRDLY